MKNTYNFSINFENWTHGMIELVHSMEYTGTKTGAIKKAREVKKQLKNTEVSSLPIHIMIYNKDLKKFI